MPMKRGVSSHSLLRKRTVLVNGVAKRNVCGPLRRSFRQSESIRRAVRADQVMVVGALYDVRSGEIDFFTEVESSRA